MAQNTVKETIDKWIFFCWSEDDLVAVAEYDSVNGKLLHNNTIMWQGKLYIEIRTYYLSLIIGDLLAVQLNHLINIDLFNCKTRSNTFMVKIRCRNK